MLEVRELSFGVLKAVSFRVRKGEVVGVIGKNGSGKSTLLKCLGGYYRYRGEVILNGREIFSYPLSQRVRLVNYLPQSFHLPFEYTVRELLYATTGRKDFEEALERFGVPHLADRLFESLSGGEKVKVLLARLYLLKPSLLLLDEPSAFLDLSVTVELASFVRQVALEGRSVLVVSHDISFLYSICDAFLGLKRGELLFAGGREELLENLELLFDCPLEVRLLGGELFIKPGIKNGGEE